MPIRNPSHRELGFTLIELMMVVVIIGILAAIAIPKFAQVSKNAKEAEAAPLLKQVYTLQERYRARENAYATSIGALEGGATLPTNGKHYDLSVIAHASGYCAVASPSAEGTAAGVTARSMDAAGTLYETADCSAGSG